MTEITPLIRSLRPTAVLAAGAIALAGLGLQGCGPTRAALGPLQYDKTSPAAGAIATTSVKGQPYPSFLDVPSQPSDVRPVSAWSRDIFAVLADRRQVDAYQVAFPQTLYGAQAFVQQSKIDLTPPPLSPAAAAAVAARATPPSPAP
jgi:hypothetical protein